MKPLTADKPRYYYVTVEPLMTGCTEIAIRGHESKEIRDYNAGGVLNHTGRPVTDRFFIDEFGKVHTEGGAE